MKLRFECRHDSGDERNTTAAPQPNRPSAPSDRGAKLALDFESELNDELETQLKSLRQTVTMQSTPAPPQEDAEPEPKAGEFYDDHYFDSDDEETGGQAQRDQGKRFHLY